jgi:hypothetical protein
MLLGIGAWSCRVEGFDPRTPAIRQEVTWVRTADGWERPGRYEAGAATPPRPHPSVVAAGQLLFSLLALLALDGRNAQARRVS